jgi:hypothetical protein
MLVSIPFYEGWRLSQGSYCSLERLIDHEETWRYTSESGALGFLIMRFLKKLVNDNIVLDVFIMCLKL